MKKFISVLLSILIIAAAVPMSATVFAAEDRNIPAVTGNDVQGSTDNTEESSQTDATEPSSETDSTEPSSETEPTEPSSETTPTEPSSETEPTVPTVKPDKVTGLKASNVDKDSLTLSWSKAKNATKYLVYRSAEDSNGKMGAFKKYKSLKETTLTENKTLKPGRIYKYKVYAYRVKNGVTTKSAATQLNIMTKPKATAKVKVTTRKSESVTLKWSSVGLATHYEIYRSGEKSDGSYSQYSKIAVLKSTKTSYVDKGLTPGRFYRYAVVVKRTKAGITRVSTGKAVKTITNLKAPKKFINKTATTSSIKLAWSKVSGASRYDLSRKTSGGDYKVIKSTTNTSFNDTGLKSGTDYTYRICAVRKVGKYAYKGEYATLSASTGTAGNVSGIKTRSYSSRALLTWNDANGSDGYEVSILKGNGKYKKVGDVSTPNYLSGKLTPGKTYKYAVKSYSYSGNTKIYGKTKYCNVTIHSQVYGSVPSGTYVEVCTETQTLYMVVNNKPYLQTPVVTGNWGELATTPGWHNVISKQSPSQLKGEYGGSTWDVTVSYWLGFTADGQGIHDSDWRYYYGGDIYKGDGSHGCVNTPYDKMAKVYAKAYIGMPVIVY